MTTLIIKFVRVHHFLTYVIETGCLQAYHRVVAILIVATKAETLSVDWEPAMKCRNGSCVKHVLISVLVVLFPARIGVAQDRLSKLE